MDFQLFNNLLDKVSLYIQKQDTVMRKCIPSIQRLSLTLRFLATGESFRSMEFATRVPACTLSRIIPETVRVIYETPDTEEEWIHVADNYLRQWNVPNCIGAMDGRHIEFKVPLSQGSLYHNYKSTNSIVLLALVNAHYQFIYVNVGVNGRVSDGGVFRESDLAKYINDSQNPLNVPTDKPLPGMNQPIPFVILADAAFPLQNHILKPYPSRNLSHDERIFNYRLSRGRRVVENAFGILANRFRVLLTQIYLSVESVQNITLACCALHNYISKENNSLQGAVDIEDLENETIIPATEIIMLEK
ncbi:putative nuclease HARBI1 isoform X2 [Mycetomoellerius zeteki]|uniref:putative nuclease HARBI1 isoform X2 n=1 Tax=Mycetomoellerius zeteki TaxID=64791 RepID=UPI00084EC798|nr:PREDICTED: putative nuclease HARBI1 isoform X2 [Trachymyrmex zeteki]